MQRKENQLGNSFALLESDSDESYQAPQSEVKAAPAPASAPPSDSLDNQPQFRVWARGPEDAHESQRNQSRFTGDEILPPKDLSILFSSPFHRAKIAEKKRWNRPRFQKDDEGWVSISWNQPQFLDESEPKETQESLTPPAKEGHIEFPSLLLRGSVDTEPEKDSAAVWAERVKKCLEKAESRPSPKERLSFFRRAIVAPAPDAPAPAS